MARPTKSQSVTLNANTESTTNATTNETVKYILYNGNYTLFSTSYTLLGDYSSTSFITTTNLNNTSTTIASIKIVTSGNNSVSSTLNIEIPALSSITLEYAYKSTSYTSSFNGTKVSDYFTYMTAVVPGVATTASPSVTSLLGTSLASFSIIPKITVFSGDFTEEVNFVISEKFNNLMEFGTISNISLRSTTNLPSFLYLGTSFAEFSVVPNLVSFFADIYGKSSLAFNELYNVDGKFFSNNSINFEEKKYSEEKFSAENSFEISELIPSVVGKFNGNNNLKLSQIGISYVGDFNGETSFKVNELTPLFTGDFNVENDLVLSEKTTYQGESFAENSIHLQTVYASLIETIFSNGIILTESNVVLGAFEESAFISLNTIFENASSSVLSAIASFNINSIVEKVNISVLERVKFVLEEVIKSELDITNAVGILRFIANEYTLIKLFEEGKFSLEEIYNLLGKFEENVSLTFNSSYNSVLSSLNSFTFSASATLNLQTIIEKINMNVLERVNFVLREFANSSFSIAEVTEKLKFISNEYTIVKLLEESNFKFTEFTSYTTQLIYEVLESINLESYISSGKFEFVETQALSFLGTTTIIGIFKELATSGFSLIAFSNAIKGYTLRATFPPFVSTTSFVSSWTNVIDMMGSILRSLGFPVTYYSDLKNIQVDTEYLMGAYVLVSAEPTLYWHNWANMYTFKLRLYDKSISLSFTKYDDAIQKQVMYKVIGNKLNDGGIIVGYNAVSNIKPMVRERKIALIEYTLRVLVMY